MPKAIVLFFVSLLLMVACQAPAPTDTSSTDGADAEQEMSGKPQQGGFLVESISADATTLNPLFAQDDPSFRAITKIYLSLLNTDPFSGEIIGSIAESWEASDDSLEYTFYLRDDINWSDGTPLTAKDVKFTFDAIASEEVGSSRAFAVQLVEEVQMVDDYTVKFVFTDVDCSALGNLGMNILPAHKFAADFSDMVDSPENEAPSVGSGPFLFKEWARDDHITLVANPDYYKGAPNVDGWTLRVFADSAAELEAILAGEIDVGAVEPQFVSTVEDAIAAGDPLAITKSFSDGYQYITFNLADPNNAQRGYVDENGNEAFDPDEPPLINDPHPVLGDIAVRKAIAHSIDYGNLIDKVLFGQGVQAVADILPAVEWAYDDTLEPYAFDPELAASILDEAGWVAESEGAVRAKDGVPLSFTLATDAGSDTNENILLIVKDSLEQIGFEVNLDIMEWGALIDILDNQTYDAVKIGWVGLGSDPDNSWYWTYRNDDPGFGFNSGSYYNETQEANIWAARSVPGCATEERAPYYKENQQIVYDEQPYTFLYVPLANTITHTRVNGTNPGPWSTYYNVEEWFIQQ
ncbi:MAG: ABC transporter substrate-binding protein [Chloroflexota bacterium]